ncbi:4-carboxymuconolactone decarboxylase [Streptomyces sp. NPDC047002]|uniref:4-carboxymuconolactone decarboxylase n=1 Tax=Streptomyces sp. NPDC047002 TaxID=3155475 RepID=UPI003451B4D2
MDERVSRVSETPPNTLQYRVDGPKDAPALVLGPSLGTTWHMWDRQVPELAKQWCVVRFDLPGHGGASAVPAASVPDLAQRLVDTLDGLGIQRFGYAGCALGAAVGAELALRRPDRVASLALVAASPRFGTADEFRQRGVIVRANGLEPMARSAPERWFTPAFAAAQPAIVEWAVQMVRTTDPACYVAACEALAAFDIRAELGRIAVPTLVLVGAEDQVTGPAEARTLVAGIPDARLALVPGASHLAPVEQPAAVTDLLTHHFSTAWYNPSDTSTGITILPERLPAGPPVAPPAAAAAPAAQVSSSAPAGPPASAPEGPPAPQETPAAAAVPGAPAAPATPVAPAVPAAPVAPGAPAGPLVPPPAGPLVPPSAAPVAPAADGLQGSAADAGPEPAGPSAPAAEPSAPAGPEAAHDRYGAGMRVRREVLGDDHVDRSVAATDGFTEDFQQLITRYAWGEIWTRDGLDRRTRSVITLTALVAGRHFDELKFHTRAALRNGLSPDEIKEVLLQTAVYCGVPAANTAFQVAGAVIREETAPQE